MEIVNFENLTIEERLIAIDDLKLRVVLASSFGVEDQLLTHIIRKLKLNIEIFTIDTGLLPYETYKLKDKMEAIYKFKYKVYRPKLEDVITLIKEQGEHGYYESLEKRKRCCYVRKILPLQEALKDVDGWITGLRREQSITRRNIKFVEKDENFNNILKFNPLADFTEKEVWELIKKENIPYNELHDRGYPSIGCQPCTRPIREGEDIRAGRWWWENPEHKECGLHIKHVSIPRTINTIPLNIRQGENNEKI